jgi:hypothetical protein
MIRIVAHRFYTSLVDAPPLIGNECMYSESLAGPLIRTFSKETMTPFYFKVGSIYLQPKYTAQDDFFGLCIVVSDEVYDGTEYAELIVAYNIPTVDILSLKRIQGDFPQNCTIDTLLTMYLESSSLVNKDQQFTLSFTCNDYPLKNYITFKVDSFTIHKHTIMEDYTDALNHELHELGIEAKVCQGVHVGLVANHEIKVDFMVSEPEPAPVYALPEKQKAIVDVPPPSKFKGDGLALTKESVSPLTREELRQKRLSCRTYGSAPPL